MEIVNATVEKNVDTLWTNINNPLSRKMLWLSYKEWFIGTWKSSDGEYYFCFDDDENVNCNLPSDDFPSTYYHIDSEGMYYLYDKDDNTEPPATRKDIFKIQIINKTQVEVYSYKNQSTYILYKN